MVGREVKNDSKVLDVNNWKNEEIIYHDRETRVHIWGKEIKSFILDILFEMQIQGGHKRVIKYTSPAFRERSRLQI